MVPTRWRETGGGGRGTCWRSTRFPEGRSPRWWPTPRAEPARRRRRRTPPRRGGTTCRTSRDPPVGCVGRRTRRPRQGLSLAARRGQSAERLVLRAINESMSTPRRRASARAHGLAVAQIVTAGACWGLSAVIAKVAFDRGVPPVRMAEARVAVALVFLLVVLASRRRDLLRIPPRSLLVLAGFGVSVAGVNASYYIAIDRLPVGVAISLQYTAPTILLGITAIRSRRRPGVRTWVAAASALTGAVLVSRAYAGL